MNESTINKVVFPVAGWGTRFLPATKAISKEMLNLVDKPLIQYAVEEAVQAGARHFIFVTGSADTALEQHFSPAPKLEAALEDAGKGELIEQLRSILPADATLEFVLQSEPRGLGDAVLCAREAVGNEHFGVILADDIIQSDAPGTFARMVAIGAERVGGVVAVESVPRDQTHRYGIVAVDGAEAETPAINGIAEKPAPDQAPSNLSVVGRYVLPPRIFELLEQTGPGAGGEIQLTDAIGDLLAEYSMFAYRFPGRRFDCGSKLGFVKASVAFARAHPEIGVEFGKHLESCQTQS